MEQSKQRFVFINSTVFKKLTFLLNTPNLQHEYSTPYFKYFLKYTENLKHLIVLKDLKTNQCLAYAYLDLMTNVDHWDVANNNSKYKEKLVKEYARVSQYSTKKISEIFSSLH